MDAIKRILISILKKDSKPVESKIEETSFYDIKINNINGKPIQLDDFKGKFILVVNVASKCGFTAQYDDLQKLYEEYQDNLVVLGVPCNQFGRQEPGNSMEIKSFCRLNYGVTFPITEKIKVKGTEQHKIYSWLTKKINNGYRNSSVRWNFQKYLIDPNGNLIKYFYSTTSPLSSKITKHLK